MAHLARHAGHLSARGSVVRALPPLVAPPEEHRMTALTDLDRLGKMLKDARERGGLSQREVAEAAGISPTYIRTLEARTNPNTKKASRPSSAIVVALAVALSSTLMSFFASPDTTLQVVRSHLVTINPPGTRSSPT